MTMGELMQISAAQPVLAQMRSGAMPVDVMKPEEREMLIKLLAFFNLFVIIKHARSPALPLGGQLPEMEI